MGTRRNMAATLALIMPLIVSENFPQSAMASALAYSNLSPAVSESWSSLSNKSDIFQEQQSIFNEKAAASLVMHKTPSAHFLQMDQLLEHSIDLNLSFRLFFYAIYFLIFVVGITGNILVCYVVFRQPSMQTVTNLFISNLAISDILLCLFCVPFTALYLLTFKEWVFGTAFCHLVPFAQGVSVYISVFTLMGISIERYAVIVHPFRRPITIPSCIAIILLIWTLAIIFTLPYGIFIDVILIVFIPSNIRNATMFERTNNNSQLLLTKSNADSPEIKEKLRSLAALINPPKLYCDEMLPNDHLRLAFGITTTVVQFIVPFCIITFCYAKVCTRLWDRIRTRPGSRNCSTQRKWLEKERARRTNSMLISMVIIFLLSWLPLNTYNLIEDIYGSVAYWRHSKSVFVLFHIFAMSSTCYNPFIYAWMNDNFKKEFQSIFLPLSTRLQFLIFGRADSATDHSKELRSRPGGGGGGIVTAQSTTAGRKMDTSTNCKDTKNCTRTTDLKGLSTDRKDAVDGEANDDCVSFTDTRLDTTTNLDLVTNLESINEIELQESLLVTSANGTYTNRVLPKITNSQSTTNTTIATDKL